MSKPFTLLGHSVTLLETRGTVVDVEVSKETVVTGSGGGGVLSHGGNGYISGTNISSETVSKTKLYLMVNGAERYFFLPGELAARKGHEVAVFHAGQGASETYAFFVNHTINRVHWKRGSELARSLGVPLENKKPQQKYQLIAFGLAIVLTALYFPLFLLWMFGLVVPASFLDKSASKKLAAKMSAQADDEAEAYAKKL